jgi:hypothetical protein
VEQSPTELVRTQPADEAAAQQEVFGDLRSGLPTGLEPGGQKCCNAEVTL